MIDKNFESLLDQYKNIIYLIDLHNKSKHFNVKKSVIGEFKKMRPLIERMSKEEHGSWSVHAQKALKIIEIDDYLKDQSRIFALVTLTSLLLLAFLFLGMLLKTHSLLYLGGVLLMYDAFLLSQNKKIEL